MRNNLMDIIIQIPAILVAFTFHEYAHAFVADRLGDKTPKFQGRLTFNPIAHIDPIGFICIVLFNFGWAKPVQTNPRAFKNYYKDDLKVSLAGPLANILVAFIGAGIMTLMFKFLPPAMFMTNIIGIIIKILNVIVYLNCIFAFFNLIPLPGLDGFHILTDLFPGKFYKFSDIAYRYQMVIFLIFIMTPIASILVRTPANRLYSFIMSVFSII
ncbi:site-2 protease family protein [Clostridium rectalis]|uniref:site-2 protease family protein n=1 Tax=Clostridium rectalis TaxID=2040295 RepID=UPI0013DDEAD4|nr:site-2 protease family protein [Clostridium rectalis]